MLFFSYALGALVLVLVLARQARVVPVPRVFSARLPVVLGVLGVFTVASYASDHHAAGGAWAWVLATLLVGAVGAGIARGLSMRVWTFNGWVLRQGTTATMALWMVTVVLALLGDAGGNHAGGDGLVGASFLLFLGLTLGVQYFVVHRRAQPMWDQLGPDAGRPLLADFLRGFSNVPGAFFTTFHTGPNGQHGPNGQPGPGGWGPGAPNGWGRADMARDGDVIDVEVVDDDEDEHEHDPPELHA